MRVIGFIWNEMVPAAIVGAAAGAALGLGYLGAAACALLNARLRAESLRRR